jgi:hypothetical protein
MPELPVPERCCSAPQGVFKTHLQGGSSLPKLLSSTDGIRDEYNLKRSVYRMPQSSGVEHPWVNFNHSLLSGNLWSGWVNKVLFSEKLRISW